MILVPTCTERETLLLISVKGNNKGVADSLFTLPFGITNLSLNLSLAICNCRFGWLSAGSYGIATKWESGIVTKSASGDSKESSPNEKEPSTDVDTQSSAEAFMCDTAGSILFQITKTEEIIDKEIRWPGRTVLCSDFFHFILLFFS